MRHKSNQIVMALKNDTSGLFTSSSILGNPSIQELIKNKSGVRPRANTELCTGVVPV